MDETRDPWGHRVVLTHDRWLHIIKAHPELERLRADVLHAAHAPTVVHPGRAADERWFYLANVGPSRWLKVVVVLDPGGFGRIITAFPRRRHP